MGVLVGTEEEIRFLQDRRRALLREAGYILQRIEALRAEEQERKQAEEVLLFIYRKWGV